MIVRVLAQRETVASRGRKGVEISVEKRRQGRFLVSGGRWWMCGVLALLGHRMRKGVCVFAKARKQANNVT
jgi:hypothetical protein